MSWDQRAKARAMWREIADGQFSREALRWIANVATSVLKADDEPNKKRRHGRIVAAVGLLNEDESEAVNIRNVVSAVDFNCELIERGSKFSGPGRPLKRGERNARRREAVIQVLDGFDDLTNAAIDQKIKRALGKPAPKK